MKSFDLVSDLHIEHYDNRMIEWNPKSDILIVAGDISNDMKLSCQKLKEIDCYETILFVDGNHEHYFGRDIDSTNYKFLMATFETNVMFLNGLNYFFDMKSKTIFIGANGWYDFKSCEGIAQNKQKELWKKTINDARMIDFGDKQPEERAVEQAELLCSYVKDAQENDDIENIVVITHTVPHTKGVVGPDHMYYNMNGGFHNTELHKVIDADTNKKIKHWVFGHTHFPKYFQYNDVWFWCNPRGYAHENQKNYEAVNIPIGD